MRLRIRGPSLSANRGFTLTELMVSLPIAATVVGVVIMFLLGTQESWGESTDRLEITQSLRTSMDIMSRDLQMAGSGFGGRTIVTGGVPGNRLHPVTGRLDSTNPDTLEIVASLRGGRAALLQAMGSASDPIFVTDIAPFAAGDLVVVTNGTDANLFEVTRVNSISSLLEHSLVSPYNDPYDHDLWPGGGYPAGTTVTQVERVSYWVEPDPRGTRLVRRSGSGAILPVTADVESMTVDFQLADGTWNPDPPDPSLIRCAAVACTARPTRNGDPGREAVLRIRPRVLR